MTNQIHPTAQIAPGVTLGQYNEIGPNVIIGGWKGQPAQVTIGDCNIINEGTRILGGPGGVTIGDWNVFHNNVFAFGNEQMSIGHNCWFGQETILDSTGGLSIGNGVRVGMRSQVWSHAASGELLEGCTLDVYRPVTIEDDAWLVGSCMVSSGVTIGRRSICLIGSVVTKDTEPTRTYAGVPARMLDKVFWREVGLDEKFEMMVGWAEEFADSCGAFLRALGRPKEIWISWHGDDVVIRTNRHNHPEITYFDLATKTYTKRLTQLERDFYRFLYTHKARFTPT